MDVRQVYSHYDLEGTPIAGLYRYCPICGCELVAAELGHRYLPSCSGCGFVQFRNPAPTVSLLIEKGGMVLLGKRRGHPGKGTWALPSGYIDYDEDFLSAAIREAKEETGLEVRIRSIVQVLSSFVSPRYHFLGLYLAADVIGGQPEAGDDLEAVGWYPIAGPLPDMGFEEDSYVIGLCATGAASGLPVDPRHSGTPGREDETRAPEPSG